MLDMRPTGVHQWLINEKEIRTGEKSTLDRNLPEDKILELPVCFTCIPRGNLTHIHTGSSCSTQATCRTVNRNRQAVFGCPYQQFAPSSLRFEMDLQTNSTNCGGALPSIHTSWYLCWLCAGDRVTLTNIDILHVTGYLIYYRFINLIIVTPFEFKVVDGRELNVNTTKNLVAVAKVLQQLFYLSTFTEKCIYPLNYPNNDNI